MVSTVMIVEDEILVALDLEEMLVALGYEPIGIAADARGAYALATRKPDIALIDLNLRDGLTGPEIGRHLARNLNTTVLFMTANPLLLGEGIAGTMGVLTKPCDACAVERGIAYAVERGGVSVAAPANLRMFGGRGAS